MRGGGKYVRLCYKNELEFSFGPLYFIDEEANISQGGERPLVISSKESIEEPKALKPHVELLLKQCLAPTRPGSGTQ